jgi:hypothetical protein
MTGPGDAGSSRLRPWMMPLVAGIVVTLLQLLLVARAGTDVPFYDQWDIEGRRLYPQWIEGSLRTVDLFAAHNEHRIAATRLLDLALFKANDDQWDPLVQLVASAFLHGAVAAILAALFARGITGAAAGGLAVATIIASLPLAGWHNALWGFQSQVYFTIGFSLLAIRAASAGLTSARWLVVAGFSVAALFSMGSGALAVAVIAGDVLVRRLFRRASTADAIFALGLLALAFALRAGVGEHAELQAGGLAVFVEAFLRMAAWPHDILPAALVLNLPLLLLSLGRVTGQVPAHASHRVPLMLGAWGLLSAAATAWMRGGGDEFAAGLPSRYVDFAVVLPLANLASLVALAAYFPRRAVAIAVMVGWSCFLLVGWLSVSMQAWRQVVSPRVRDRDAPVRLMQAYSESRDAAVFSNQPRLYVPHPNLGVVDAVLDDPQMKSALPPSLQTGRVPGPLSRGVRKLLGIFR